MTPFFVEKIGVAYIFQNGVAYMEDTVHYETLQQTRMLTESCISHSHRDLNSLSSSTASTKRVGPMP